MKRNSAGCDKVKVRMVDSTYWGEGVNFNNKFLHIPSQYVRDYERLLMGGVWAQVDMRFESDQESKGKNPFWIDKLVPIQIATFDLDDYRNVRKQFTTDEWIDLIVRSMGYEPGEMSRRLKLLFLVRLIPLGERNYNLVELGPRGTGKSYVIQEVSPYTALLTGGLRSRICSATCQGDKKVWSRFGTSLVSTRSLNLAECRAGCPGLRWCVSCFLDRRFLPRDIPATS
jgi:uncharacterized protein (TIGR02688 family)